MKENNASRVKQMWISARHLPDAVYMRVSNYITGIAGDGDPTTPEELGLPRNAFAWDELFIVRRVEGHYDVVYSLNRTNAGGVCFELFSTYQK